MVGRLRRAVKAAADRVGARTLIWGAALAGLAAVLDFVPLCDLLGYDFSFALGLVAALAAVDVGAGVVTRARRAGGGVVVAPSAAAIGRLYGEAIALALALLVPPLLLSLANAARVRNCDVPVGLAFFALLPVATVLYAAPVGVTCALAAPRRGRLLAFAVPVLSLLCTLLRLYRDPPVFAYDPFGGYFPGPIYDEALRPPLPLITFRVACAVWISTTIALALAAAGRGLDPRRWRPGALAAAAPLAAASVALFALGGPLGFHVRRGDVERVLGRALTTEHFVLRYDPAAMTRAEAAMTGQDLEFRYDQLRHILGVEPRLPITVWDFPRAEVKKQLVGAGNTLYAKPWTREIFVQGEVFPSTRLRHEMAHVFAGAFGDPVFGVSFAWRLWGPLPRPVLAMGLVEGLAEAADAGDPDGDATIHQQAAAMIADGLAPPLARVVGASFSTLAGPRAYTIAGSFCAFLLTTRGPDKLRQLYRSAGNFTDVYRVPLAALEREWRAFLATQPVTTRERAHASEAFRRPAIFERVCARELAARVAEARAIANVDPERAVTLLQSTCRDDPREPTYAVALAAAQAAAGQIEPARATLARLAIDGDVTVPLRAQAAGITAAIDFAARDYAHATAAEQQAADLAATEVDRRQALAKLRALATPTARATLGRALFGDQIGDTGVDNVLTFYLFLEFARLHPTDPLGPYLVGRQLLFRDPAQALPQLSRACGDADAPLSAAATPLPPEFVRECRRMTTIAALSVGDFARARAALALLGAEAASEADRLRVLDMRARVDWTAARRAETGRAFPPYPQ